MDTNNDDLPSSHEDDIDFSIQTPNNLDLNIEQECRSPNVAHVGSAQSNLSSKHESNLEKALKIGMEFESDEHAYRFYNKYAGLVGFSVRKDWVNRSKVHGRVVSRKFTCSKEGYRRKDKRDVNVKKHRKETRTGCLAHMIITRQPDGKYRITHFEANHNHENVNPLNGQNLAEIQSLGTVDDARVTETDSLSDLDKQSRIAYQLLGRRFCARELLECPVMAFDNFLKTGRERDWKEGEAGRLLYYFQRQHFENPSFFYSIQLDVDDKMSNIFWADDNMVMDFDHFGDVVCLDTTHRTNDDFRPFVQFLGLNHHRQVVIFGAALMYDGTVDSFKWLFQTFVESMSGKKPKTILTFQDAAIIQAIDLVFPETNRRVCVWQMYRNSLEHLTDVTKDTESFAKDLKTCIFYPDEEEDFIHDWDAMIEKFSLQKNEWLRWMFREKEKWAAVYGKNTFFIDMEKRHLGEVLSDNLSNYLSPDLDVLQFFKHFESVVDEQRYKEFKANFDMGRCTPRLMANVVLLKHASSLYTPRAFELFQREYEKCLNVVVNLCSENGSLFDYKANTFGRSREYTVAFNSSDNTVCCSCMKFEFVGFLCCHALKVLDHRNIKVVPAHYISNRWTRDACIENCKESCGTSNVEENPKLITANRYRELCQRILKISARASDSDKAFVFASKQLDEVIQGVEKILTLKPSEETQAVTSSTTGAYASESDQAEIFQGMNVIEGQDDSNTFRKTSEREIAISDEDPLNQFLEKMSNSQTSQNMHSPVPETITSISYQPAYVSSASSSLNPISQGFYNFEGAQVVECLYQSPNLPMDQQPNAHTYQPPSLFSNQHDSPSQARLLQDSFQESTQRNQLRQAMDLDVQHPHSASYICYDQGYRASNGHYFVSK